MDIHVFQANTGEELPSLSQPVRSSAPNIIARRIRERVGANLISPRASSYIEVKGANVSLFRAKVFFSFFWGFQSRSDSFIIP